MRADLLADYARSCEPGDLYGDAPAEVRPHWARLVAGLSALAHGNFGDLDARLEEEVRDLGLAFRATGEDEERDWPLTPLPLVIGTAEWEAIAAGVIQRASLVEQIVADVYGPQQLVRDGHLPAAVLSGSPFYAPRMVGMPPPGGQYMHIYAADLARGPSGEWRVLADRTRFATGIGYALENRLATSRISGSLLSDINSRRLAEFFGLLRGGIAADCARAEPRIALLTPGRFNQSYAEQAHLARYLGFPLVEGRDLAVSDNRLYVRTIAGLKRVDAIWRWLDTRMLDPLAFDSTSQIGVPDMLRALGQGGLVSANWPGTGVVEASAFAAFLPRLARLVLGEPLRLPNAATWWCGQEREREIVTSRFDELVICSAFGQPVAGLPEGRTQPGATLDASARQALLAAMARRPMDYCGQEIVRLSTTPTLAGDRLEPRPFTLRVFAARGPDGRWHVMPGGFARLSAQSRMRTTLMGEGDLSADVCIVDDQPVAQSVRLSAGTAPVVHRNSGILPSQAADNLFWFGRYLERAESTARLVRALLGSSVEADGATRRGSSTLDGLAAMLVTWGALPVDGDAMPVGTVARCAAALRDTGQAGSLASLLATVRGVSRRLRDRLANDVWRIANLPLAGFDPASVDQMRVTTNRTIDRLGAIAGLMAENMGRGAAWRFLDLGRRIERAGNMADLAAQLASDADPATDDLGILLDLADSQILYRTRYLAAPARDAVLDLVVLDDGNPRSMAFQLKRVQTHLRGLPSLSDNGLHEPPLRAAIALFGAMETLTADRLDRGRLRRLRADVDGVSVALAQRFFLQAERPDHDGFGNLLG